MKRMFDYVIVDAGQSTNETALKVLQMSDNVLLVSILSLPCLSNTNRLVKSFIELGFRDQNRIQGHCQPLFEKRGDLHQRCGKRIEPGTVLDHSQ